MKDVIELAKQAGDDWDSTRREDKEFLFRFATLVRNATLEEASSLCERLWPDDKRSGHEWSDGWADGTCASADAIRNLKEPTP